MDPPPRPVDFEHLPSEIRVQIYEAAFPYLSLRFNIVKNNDQTAEASPFNHAAFHVPDEDYMTYQAARQLLFVSRSIRNEALPVFRSKFLELQQNAPSGHLRRPVDLSINLHSQVKRSVRLVARRLGSTILFTSSDFPGLTTIVVQIFPQNCWNSERFYRSQMLESFAEDMFRSWEKEGTTKETVSHGDTVREFMTVEMSLTDRVDWDPNRRCGVALIDSLKGVVLSR